jgi:hypothetical protein
VLKRDQNVGVGIILTVLIIIYWVLFDFMRWNQWDSTGYMEGSRLILDWNYVGPRYRLNKFGSLLLPGILEKIFGIWAGYGFIIQNILMFYGSGFLLFHIILRLTQNTKQAYFGMFLFFTNQIVAIFGINILTDMSGWFMAFVAMYCCLIWREKLYQNIYYALLLGFVNGLAICFKENAVIACIFCCAYILFLPKLGFLRKIRTGILFALGFLLMPLASYFFVKQVFNYTVLTHYAGEALFRNRSYTYSVGILKQLYITVHTHWIFIGLGFWFCVKNKLNFETNALVFGGIVSLLILPIGWAVHVDRVLFSVMPLLLIIASYSFPFFKNRLWFFAILSGTIAVLSHYIIYRYNSTPNIILMGIITMAGTLLIWFIFQNLQLRKTQ